MIAALTLLQKPAVLFYFGFKPFKIFCDAVNQIELHEDDLKDIDLPRREKGYFYSVNTVKEIINDEEEELNIYVYVFTNTIGCGNYRRDFHGKFPPEVPNSTVTDAEILNFKANGILGTSFFYYEKNDQPIIEYNTDGTYTMTGKASNTASIGDHEASIEHERAERHRSAVLTYLEQEKKKVKFIKSSSISSEVALHVTPFKGGGDDVLVAVPQEKLILQADDGNGNSSSDDEENTHTTLAPVDYKDKTSRTKKKIKGQLHANMLLLSVKCFVHRLKNLTTEDSPISNLKKLKLLVAYGLSFGSTCPIIVKKMIIDLSNKSINIEKKYESPRDTDKPPRLACATLYLIDKIEKGGSPTPA